MDHKTTNIIRIEGTTMTISGGSTQFIEVAKTLVYVHNTLIVTCTKRRSKAYQELLRPNKKSTKTLSSNLDLYKV